MAQISPPYRGSGANDGSFLVSRLWLPRISSDLARRHERCGHRFMPSERTDDEGLRAKRLTRYDRPSALACAVVRPCRAQHACALHCSKCCNLPTIREGAFPRAPRHGRGIRVGSIRSAVPHVHSAMASGARLVGLGCPWLLVGVSLRYHRQCRGAGDKSTPKSSRSNQHQQSAGKS
jgi:hypothetical protein